jgi:hypothetical protein
MNKDELLQELKAKVATREISQEEIARVLNLGTVAPQTVGGENHSFFSATRILYFLGAAIVIVGILVFVSQIWSDIGSFGRITISLGLGLLMAALGSLLLTSKPEEHIGSIFHVIGGVLIPSGAMVTLSEMNIPGDDIWLITIAFGSIFAFYLLLNAVHKNAVLTFFAIANGTVFAYALTAATTQDLYYTVLDDIFAYLTMVLGLSYLLLAHGFKDSWNKKLISALCLFGSAGFLGAAFSRVFDSGLWELLFFVLVSGGLALSVYMKSRIILIISTLFLIAHVIYITDEYFANSLGWPLSLVLLGFVFIGLGYFTVNLNKKYISA